jgi:hypothetical protein
VEWENENCLTGHEFEIFGSVSAVPILCRAGCVALLDALYCSTFLGHRIGSYVVTAPIISGNSCINKEPIAQTYTGVNPFDAKGIAL